MNSEANKRKADRADELLARILDVAPCVKKSDDLLRRTTRDIHTRVGMCTEVTFACVNSKRRSS